MISTARRGYRTLVLESCLFHSSKLGQKGFKGSDNLFSKVISVTHPQYIRYPFPVLTKTSGEIKEGRMEWIITFVAILYKSFANCAAPWSYTTVARLNYWCIGSRTGLLRRSNVLSPCTPMQLNLLLRLWELNKRPIDETVPRQMSKLQTGSTRMFLDIKCNVNFHSFTLHWVNESSFEPL